MEFLKRQIFPRTEKIVPETMTTQFWDQECRMITHSADPRMPNRQWGITQFTSLNSQKSPELEENQEGMKAIGSVPHAAPAPCPPVHPIPHTWDALFWGPHKGLWMEDTRCRWAELPHQSSRINAQQPPPPPLLPGSQDTGKQTLTYLPTYRENKKSTKELQKIPRITAVRLKGLKKHSKKWIKYTSWKTSMGNSLTLVKKKRLNMLLERKKKKTSSHTKGQ